MSARGSDRGVTLHRVSVHAPWRQRHGDGHAVIDKLHPYVEVAGGLAKIKRDVKFTVGGTDVTDKLSTYGIVLGTGLAGTESKLMIGGGGGVVYDITSSVIFEPGHRFSRISTDPCATNVNRVGAGIGIRF